MGFQSTLPVWGATGAGIRQRAGGRISIHAPRVGSDSMESAAALEALNFNPRSPCGERRFTSTATATGTGFQSTLPVWGATGAGELCGASLGNFNPRSPCGERPHPDLDFVAIFGRFQSTLPVWGATHCSRRRFSHSRHFNPRSPCGERPQQLDSQAGVAIISIHAPRVGSDPTSG